MARVRIYLRGGQTIDAECTSLEAKRNASNDLVSLSWKELRPASLYLRLADVSAIIELKGNK